MANRSWHLDRRSFLHGVGVTLTLPYLEAMGTTITQPKNDAARKRLCCLYFPNGCGIPNRDKDSTAHSQWSWFPLGEGRDYELTNTLSVLADHRQEMSILGELSHPRSRELLGHIAGDSWLTGGDVSGSNYRNNISIDQVAARKLGESTRYPSLTLSVDGGVGYQSRVSTLSFDDSGKPIPAEHRHRAIFERYFSPAGGTTTRERQAQLQRGRRIVDLVLEDSRRLSRQLGNSDRRKLDEFLASLSRVEQQIQRNEKWLKTPHPDVSADHIDFEVDATRNPEAYIRSMLDIMVLGLQTDMTRVMTYMLGREDGIGFADHFPKLACGIKRGHHSISHSTEWENWSNYDRWLASHCGYFLERLKTVSDESGPLLDNTLVLFGSACSTTHNARNYPLVLAGGKQLGVQHGSYRIYGNDIPMTNLFVSMLNTLGVTTTRYSDSTGPLPGDLFS